MLGKLYDDIAPSFLPARCETVDIDECLDAIQSCRFVDDHMQKIAIRASIWSIAIYIAGPDAEGPDLRAVLQEAQEQALGGKGQDRHADGTGCFDDEHWLKVTKIAGPGFLLGQAAKKLMESERLSPEHARIEVLGAINYLAFAAIWYSQ